MEKTRHLRIANVEPVLRYESDQYRQINVQRVIAFMARLGLHCELVDIVEEDTEDGMRQCRMCLTMKPVSEYVFKNDLLRQKRNTGSITSEAVARSRICSKCRTAHRVGWNHGMKSYEGKNK